MVSARSSSQFDFGPDPNPTHAYRPRQQVPSRADAAYADVGADDYNGGCVELDGRHLEMLKDGQRVRVYGQLIPADRRGGAARFVSRTRGYFAVILLSRKRRCLEWWRRRKPTPVTFDQTRDELTVHLERAVLVSVALPDRPFLGDDPLDELRGLATTAGAVVVGGLMPEPPATSSPAPTSARASSRSCRSRSRPTDADVVIFDNDLSPGPGPQPGEGDRASRCSTAAS